ncbi:MAG: 50S ribosome-binding GTPase [Candidatus Shikimatogenerans sp. JK-2022]|nr:50S ribosome-binding GTPase [Candidatus Shikimatogenerans bostrichidophilus]
MNKIIIIGKSNVGKSTLFNFLIKEKRSIISKKKNTTLNINNGFFKIKNIIYNLIDTGGYNNENFIKKNIIYNKVNKQILLYIKKSDLILLIVDIQEGINYLDKELFLFIKKNNKDFFLLVNKIDKKKNIQPKYNFYNFFIEKNRIFFISITNNKGIDELKKNIYIYFKKKNIFFKNNFKNIKISILGIPNSGKSTFINSFFLKKNISIVSKIEGTTKDSLYFNYKYKSEKKNYILVDTPGINKYFKFLKNKKKKILIIKKTIKVTNVCILIIDIIKGISKNDLFLKDLIIKNKKGIIVILNKCDLLKKNNTKIKEENKINKYIPIKYYSLKYNFNKKKQKEIKKLINKININRKKKFSTSFLNNILLKKINNKKYKINNKIFKVKFCYQLKSKSYPFFIFISNLEKKINLIFKRKIEKLIRKYIFNFNGVPIKFIFKKNKKKC